MRTAFLLPVVLIASFAPSARADASASTVRVDVRMRDPARFEERVRGKDTVWKVLCVGTCVVDALRDEEAEHIIRQRGRTFTVRVHGDANGSQTLDVDGPNGSGRIPGIVMMGSGGAAIIGGLSIWLGSQFVGAGPWLSIGGGCDSGSEDDMKRCSDEKNAREAERREDAREADEVGNRALIAAGVGAAVLLAGVFVFALWKPEVHERPPRPPQPTFDLLPVLERANRRQEKPPALEVPRMAPPTPTPTPPGASIVVPVIGGTFW